MHRSFSPLARLKLAGEQGETLIGFLVTLVISTALFSAAIKSFVDASHRGRDIKLINRAEGEARTILDMIAFDLRHMGSGMPLGQADFQIGDLTLGNAPLPILTSSTATHLVFRMNENGVSTLLSSASTPVPATAPVISVLSTADIEDGDTIYISDMSVGGNSGLRGVVTGHTSTTITLDSSFTANTGASFASGSVLSRVTELTYSSTSTGITRNDETGPVLLAPNTSLALEYLDGAGAALTLPLTDAAIRDSLHAIRVTVTATSSVALSSKIKYSASATQVVGMRNLNITR